MCSSLVGYIFCKVSLYSLISYPVLFVISRNSISLSSRCQENCQRVASASKMSDPRLQYEVELPPVPPHSPAVYRYPGSNRNEKCPILIPKIPSRPQRHSVGPKDSPTEPPSPFHTSRPAPPPRPPSRSGLAPPIVSPAPGSVPGPSTAVFRNYEEAPIRPVAPLLVLSQEPRRQPVPDFETIFDSSSRSTNTGTSTSSCNGSKPSSTANASGLSGGGAAGQSYRSSRRPPTGID